MDLLEIYRTTILASGRYRASLKWSFSDDCHDPFGQAGIGWRKAKIPTKGSRIGWNLLAMFSGYGHLSNPRAAYTLGYDERCCGPRPSRAM